MNLQDELEGFSSLLWLVLSPFSTDCGIYFEERCFAWHNFCVPFSFQSIYGNVFCYMAYFNCIATFAQ